MAEPKKQKARFYPLNGQTQTLMQTQVLYHYLLVSDKKNKQAFLSYQLSIFMPFLA